jgi:hypothetical protein
LAQALGALWWLKKNPYLCWESNLGRYWLSYPCSTVSNLVPLINLSSVISYNGFQVRNQISFLAFSR